MLVPMDHCAAQRGARLVAIAKIDQRQRLLTRQRLGGSDRQTGTPQEVREMHHVGGEGGGALGGRMTLAHSAACRASVTSRAASAPRTLAMSSWYFSSTPSVSSTAAGASSVWFR